MTKQEWNQMEDELEPIIKKVWKICRQHGLEQLDIATFSDSAGPCWATGYTNDPGEKGADFYTLNVFADNHTTHELNAEVYYTKIRR